MLLNVPMMSMNITDKSYKKLVLQVSLNGLSFVVIDLLSGHALDLKSITFDPFHKNTPIEDLFMDVFKEHPVLKNHYDEIVVIHSNNLSTFVPTALFDEEYLASYLQYNTKVFETDFFTFDELKKHEMNTVYIPYVNMNNFFIDQLGSFEYQHSSTVLVSNLLDFSKNNDERKMFVHKSAGHFEIVIVQNQRLHLYNSFEYTTPEDFIYYILFTAEQLQLNPEYFPLEFIGNITEEDDYYQIAYTYIRNVSLFKAPTTDPNWTEEENRAHFILLHS